MDDDVDLAFMEYITNDGSDFKNELGRRVYERLVRKVAGRASAPAVVMVQLPTAGMGFANEHPRKYHFHQTREDVYNTVAAYYDMPSLSLRWVPRWWWHAAHGRVIKQRFQLTSALLAVMSNLLLTEACM